jgi:hypothetical protein
MSLRLAPRIIKSRKNTSEVIAHGEAVTWFRISQSGGPGGIPE